MSKRSPAERARFPQVATDDDGRPRLGPVLGPILAPVLNALRDPDTLPACREVRRDPGVSWLLPGSDLPRTLLCGLCAYEAGLRDLACIACGEWCGGRNGQRLATVVGDVTVELVVCHACAARDLAGDAS